MRLALSGTDGVRDWHSLCLFAQHRLELKKQQTVRNTKPAQRTSTGVMTAHEHELEHLACPERVTRSESLRPGSRLLIAEELMLSSSHDINVIRLLTLVCSDAVNVVCYSVSSSLTKASLTAAQSCCVPFLMPATQSFNVETMGSLPTCMPRRWLPFQHNFRSLSGR